MTIRLFCTHVVARLPAPPPTQVKKPLTAKAFSPHAVPDPLGTALRRARRPALCATFLATTLLVITGANPASAEYKTTTSQALAAHAEWLPYAPPPPAGAAAVCLVDTGVDLNPDTSSNVIARIALDGGDPGDASPSKHGTEMAMVMGAPINGWGMVGAWPAVRIDSVALRPDADGRAPLSGYHTAVQRCIDRSNARRALS